VTKEGVEFFRELIYRKGESLEEYFAKIGYGDGVKYPVCCCGFLQDGEYFWENDETESNWDVLVNDFISSIDDETVIVGIDCHS